MRLPREREVRFHSPRRTPAGGTTLGASVHVPSARLCRSSSETARAAVGTGGAAEEVRTWRLYVVRVLVDW